LLKNINLNINFNDSIGISGKTGSGKSTLINIIMGLYELNNGYIRIDDKNLTKNNSFVWQSKISLVSQNIFIIDDTIKANIIYGRYNEKIDKDLLEKAIKISCLDLFIKELDDGLNTKIGQRGTKISGGQKQRIGIARAIYLNRPILILDEPTSALDKKTENLIISNLKSLRDYKTLIILSHEDKVLEICKTIYKVDNNELSLIR